MSDVALRMEHVYKKFSKGEMYNSLRDLLPALTGRMFQQRDLQAGHQDFWALQDLTFEVPRGEAFGIIGHNGAGKSTALKILSKIMKPTRGSMVVDGRLSALIEVTAGFHQDLTGRENIYLHGTILGMSKREIASKLDQIIAFSGLEDFIDTPVKRYSSGMYARLGFSVAAHVDPEVLIVDEVLSVGDYVFQRKCVNRMKDVIKSGATVLFVSHNLTTVAEFCHRCLLLDKGRAVMIGPAPEVISSYLDRARSAHDTNSATSPVSITRVQVRNEFGECSRFQSGQKAWVDIEIAARQHCTKLSVSLFIIDDAHQDIFNTSTERLGLGNFTLEEGETYTCTYELNLNMAAGMYHPAVLVYRYDNQTSYDLWEPAATIYVSSDDDVRGFVHCAPKVIQHQIVAAPNANLAGTASTVASQTKREPQSE
jgi:lipopolysaccharide transport system ATP-binding protein